MTEVGWATRPKLEAPILLAAFEGFNDEAGAATMAVEHLHAVWGAQGFADIPAEEFFDFTVTRPTVVTVGGRRRVRWPLNRFAAASPEGFPDVVLLRGTEPNLRWRTFAELVADVAVQLGARLVCTLGSVLSEIPHTREVPVFGSSEFPEVASLLGLGTSSFEGPTGFTGALHEECRDRGCNSAALWAAVPSYLPGIPSPKAAVALVRQTAALFGPEIATGDLLDRTRDYEHQADALVASDPEVTAYVARIEAEHDAVQVQRASGAQLVDEVERFLRGG